MRGTGMGGRRGGVGDVGMWGCDGQGTVDN